VTSASQALERIRWEAKALPARGDDPLVDAEQLILRIYAYVAYRLGSGAEAEDVVSATFERAVRYRHTYNRRRGEPIAWLVGIARHCMDDALAARARGSQLVVEDEVTSGFEDASIARLELRDAVARLGHRDQELIALRYGADLSVKSIARLIGSRPNAVDVALHRALGRLRGELAPTATRQVEVA
jgi:RNA polymerase sigma-70 factor (ECF subfamily)